MYRRLAEIAGEYLRKGSQIYVEGKLQTRKWQDQSGQDRYTTEVIADQMQMLGGGKGGQAGQSDGGSQAQSRQASPQANQGYNQAAPSYQKMPNQGAGTNQGGSNQGYNQSPAGQKNQPPMVEPDFDFDDDIPF